MLAAEFPDSVSFDAAILNPMRSSSLVAAAASSPLDETTPFSPAAASSAAPPSATASAKSFAAEKLALQRAVEHLLELAEVMTSPAYSFRDEDVLNIDSVVDALETLEKEKSRLHQDLETASITAATLRSRLQRLPSRVEEEMEEAIQIARESNAEAMTALQERLESINDEILRLQEKLRELDRVNAELSPGIEKKTKDFDSVVERLNERIGDKSTSQIKLNATRDRLRDTKRKIRDIEEEMNILAQEMLEEREEHNRRKEEDKKRIVETSDELNRCRQTNFAKKKEVDALHERCIEKEAANNGLEEAIARIEESCETMTAQKEALEEALQAKIAEHQAAVREGAAITAKRQKGRKEFDASREIYEKKIDEIQRLFVKNKKKLDALDSEFRNLKAELAKAELAAAEEEAKERELFRALSELKNGLVDTSSEVNRLVQENQDMEREIEEVKELHSTTMEELRDVLNDLEQQLETATVQRLQSQEERNSLLRQTDEYRAEYADSVNEATERISKGKQLHEKLSKEGTDLSKALKELDLRVKDRKEGTARAKEDYRSKKQELEVKLTSLKDEIKVVGEDIEKREELDTTASPAFENTERAYLERTAEFSALKSRVSGQRNHSDRLVDDIDSAERKNREIKKPIADLKRRVDEGRTEFLELMEAQHEEMERMERDVYLLGCQLKVVVEENSRFAKGVDEVMEAEAKASRDIEANHLLAAAHDEESETIRCWLRENWTEDATAQDEAGVRDESVVGQIGGLLRSTADREEKVLFITRQLYEQLRALSAFLTRMGEPLPLGESPTKELTSTMTAAAASSRMLTPALTMATLPKTPKKRKRSKRQRDRSSLGEEAEESESRRSGDEGSEDRGKGLFNGGVVKSSVNPNPLLPPIQSK